MSRNRLALVLAGILLVLVAVWGCIATRNDWARRDATFLAQCHEAGYDAAKCRFFLTAMSRASASAAAMQMMIETPK
jgi:hypothetical protein